MRNELLLIVTLLVLYGSVLLWFFLFGTSGLMAFTVFATIAANIEVLILVQAFGMEMTLGNILFATTFLVTDILSEIAGKKQAKQAVWIGIAANVLFVLVSQSWLMYVPSVNDWATPYMQAISQRRSPGLFMGAKQRLYPDLPVAQRHFIHFVCLLRHV